MIIFDRNTKDLEIPAGLGNLEINVESRCGGVTSIDGETGALTTKTVNGESILGTGNIETLPVASSETLGGVKIGDGLSIESGGTLSLTKKDIYLNELSQEESYALVNELRNLGENYRYYLRTHNIYAIFDTTFPVYAKIDYINFTNSGTYLQLYSTYTIEEANEKGPRKYLCRAQIQLNSGNVTYFKDWYVETLCVNAKGNDLKLSYDDSFYRIYFDGKTTEQNNPVSLYLENARITTPATVARQDDKNYMYAEWIDASGVTYEAKWELVKNSTPIYVREKSSGGGVTSGEVQTMIDSALTDYATTAVTDSLSTAVNGKMAKQTKGGLAQPIYSNNGILNACRVSTTAAQRYNSVAINDSVGNLHAGKAVVFHQTSGETGSSVQLGKLPTKGGFTVFYPNDGTDYTVSNNQHFIVDSDDLVHIKKITQADYDALVLAGTVDEHTLYLVI